MFKVQLVLALGPNPLLASKSDLVSFLCRKKR